MRDPLIQTQLRRRPHGRPTRWPASGRRAITTVMGVILFVSGCGAVSTDRGVGPVQHAAGSHFRALEPEWRYRGTVGGRTTTLVAYRGGAAISQGWVAFIEVPFTPEANRLTCLDLESGRVLWQRRVADDVRCVAFGSQLLVVTSEQRGSASTIDLEVVDATSGRHMAAVRLAVADAASSAVATLDAAYVSTRDGKMICVDAASHSVLWQEQLAPDEQAHGLLFAGDRNVFIVTPRKLRALSRSDRRLWESNAPELLGCDPLLTESLQDRLVIAGHDAVAALDATTGRLLWKRAVRGPLRQTGISAEQGVYLAATEGSLLAMSLHDGHALWEQTLSSVGPPSGLTSLTTAGGHVFLYPMEADRDWYLHAFTLSQGKDVLRDPDPFVVGLRIMSQGTNVVAPDFDEIRGYDVAKLGSDIGSPARR